VAIPEILWEPSVEQLVMRGPTWKWGRQDGWFGNTGMVSETPRGDDHWITVEWIGGSCETNGYRVGSADGAEYLDVIPISGGIGPILLGKNAPLSPLPPPGQTDGIVGSGYSPDYLRVFISVTKEPEYNLALDILAGQGYDAPTGVCGPPTKHIWQDIEASSAPYILCLKQRIKYRSLVLSPLSAVQDSLIRQREALGYSADPYWFNRLGITVVCPAALFNTVL